MTSERFAGRPPDDLEFPRQLARTRGFTCGQPRSFTVSPDGERVVFLRSGAGDDPVLKLWALDVAIGTERCVFDPLAEPGSDVELTPAERARRERKRERATGVVAYACDRDVTAAVFVEGGRLHHVDVATAAVRELPAPGVPDDPRLSPAGDRVAFVIDGALHVLDVAHGQASRVLASDDDPDVSWGLAEFAAAEELGRGRGFWWSPDGSRIAAARVNERPVERWWITDPTDPTGEPRPARYPRAGTANAVVTLHVIDVATGAFTDLAWDEPERFEYLRSVGWDEDPLTLQIVSRDQKEMRVLEADPSTGVTKTVAVDVDETWVAVVAGVPARLDDGRLVTSGVHGDVRAVAVDGEVVSGPKLHVHHVAGTNGDEVLVAGWAGDPTEEHVWSLAPGRDPERVTSDVGLHDLTSSGGTAVITSCLEPEDHPRVVVWGGGDHPSHVVENLAEVPVVAAAPRHLWVGPLRLPVVVCTPGGAEPGSKLPVLVSSYGGPHVNDVGRWRGMHRVSQWFADRLGAAVLTIDGRGMAGHGIAWEKAIHLDFGLTLEDQVAGLHGAAEELGYLDLDRVAFRGWSFGGMLGAMAVLRRPDVFHCAVAGAPVSDQRLYDTAYTERYLGMPDEQSEAYRVSSPISFVDDADPHRPLLLIHGLADDNVYAAHTLQLSAALFARGYRHDLVLLPNASHIGGFDDLVTARYLAELDFLRRSLELEVP